MIEKWDKLSVGGFLSLPRTAEVLKEKFPRFTRANFSAQDFARDFWREPMLDCLLRFPYLKTALALDFYRVGFFQLVTYKKASVNETFLMFTTQILFASASNPFCVLALIKGQTCRECEICLKGAFVPTREWGGLYDRCESSPPYNAVWEAISGVQRNTWRVSHIGRWLRDRGFLQELKKISEW